MLNVDERTASGRQSAVTRWVYQTVNLQGVRVQVRFRGNVLHILFEGQQCPDAAIIMTRLVQALAATDISGLLSQNQYQVYQLFLYGRAFGSDRPNWTHPIFLNQLDRHLEQIQQFQPPQPDFASYSLQTASAPTSHPINRVSPQRSSSKSASKSKSVSRQASAAPQSASNALSDRASGSALLVPNRSLAKQGRPDAIARYLSETLSALGVAVEVTVKTIQCPPEVAAEGQQRNRRLVIICESTYSPEPSLICEPIAQQLRDLQLEDFRDAIIFSQVSGEDRPDWRLRVDLTPPEEMLKEWARWGDVQAIARLVNQDLAQQKIQATAELKESTLHILCSVLAEASNPKTQDAQPIHQAPDKLSVMGAIAPLLESLAPQGIHAATIYGQIANQDAPAWIDWLNLPASMHEALAEPAIALAQKGDQPALSFLLSRMLNPDLDWRLATGGIGIQLLHKEDLLHVMSDAPVCPRQSQVGPPVAKFLRQLRLPEIAGVRVYGRRSGQKRPLWSYGADFVTSRKRLVPQAAPEFAASDAYVSELFGQPAGLVLRPEFSPDELQATLTQTTQRLVQTVHNWLVRSQLFVPSDHALGQNGYQGTKLALVWATLGLLLTLQSDWLLGQILTWQANRAIVDTSPTVKVADSRANPSQPRAQVPAPPISSPLSGNARDNDEGVFNASGFTAEPAPVATNNPDLPATARPLTAEPLKASAASSAILAAARSPYPTFNSRQLDEKLALYQQRVAESGPPDILIIGSSRALRGVDPVALQKALAAQGYPGLTVFNFGVNGATAQVVDVIIRQILTPEQMPKLILWADGARAFNSGRVDITYNAIAVSEGYRQLAAGTLPSFSNNAAQPEDNQGAIASVPAIPIAPPSASLTDSYQAVNRWLNEAMGSVSATYAQRDQLKALFKDQLSALIPEQKPSLEQLLGTQSQFAAKPGEADPANGESADDSLLYAIDFDGFLPLSLRFNPATYYQKYAKVSGDYDSDYEAFKLEGKQSEALEALLQFTQAQQIPVVFVNLPLTQDYLDFVRLEHEEEFRLYMLRLATQKGFVFRDLGQLWPTENDYFSDPSHLNRYGAYEVSNRLAQDPIIPWPQPADAEGANE